MNEFLIIALALAAMCSAAVLASLRRKGAGIREYFFAGQSAGWPVLAGSFAATTIWGIWSLAAGLPVGAGTTSWILGGCGAIVGLTVLATLLAPVYRTSSATTMPALLGERFGVRTGKAVAAFSIWVTVFALIPFTLLVGVRLVNALVGWDLKSSALLLIVIPGLIVIAGGYRAVIAAQGVAGIVAAAGLVVLAVNGIAPVEEMLARVAPTGTVSWIPVIAGMSVMGIWFTGADQSIVQRAIAAKSSGALRAGAGIAALLVALGVVAILAGSAVGRAGPDPVSSGLLAGCLGALIICGGIASLSGFLMSAATVFAMDIFDGRQDHSADAALVLVGRLASTVVVVLAIVASSFLAAAGAESATMMVRAVAIAVPPVAAITLLGLPWSRMNSRGALWALVTGWVVGIAYESLSPGGTESMLQGAGLSFAVSGAVLIGVSMVFNHAAEVIQPAGHVLTGGVRKP